MDSRSDEYIDFVVEKDDVGQRLDLFLAIHETDAGISRSQIKDLLTAGHISVNDQKKKAAYRLRAGDRIEVFVPAPVSIDLVPEEVPFKIIFEDHDLIVLSKPPGLVVHPACGHQSGTLVHGLLFHCDDLAGINGEQRPGIVHRLDKDTSGVMVVAKNDRAHHSLVEQFKGRRVKKTYRALLDGIPKLSSGRIDSAIGRHPVNRKKMAVREYAGKEAITNWKVIESFPAGFAYVEIGLETGRTHQIRVHMAAAGFPVAGDDVYGRKNQLSLGLGITRQCLHAFKLSIEHPVSGEFMTFCAPLCDDMLNTLEILRGSRG
ncbi:MAG: RluA family pseudouridine synthase [Proteobacteria bacterium]|nr:RluA family pseudouridine synthase [Pseudomonadota bacterium]MBU1714551.1 RluA family pseudouridine synthase [Pseudomonadota bacterium]